MARVPYLDEKDVAPEDRAIFARGLNLYRVLAHSPKAARAFERFSKFLRYESRLDPRLRELAILQIGFLTHADYSFYGHIGHVSGDFAVSDADIRGMIADTKGEASDLEPLARDVLRAAREITRTAMISDEAFAPLEKAFAPEILVDLVSTMAFYNAAVRFIRSMKVDIEPHRMEQYLRNRDRYPFGEGLASC
jgi:alkylhydroperoxidase family enzyme